MLIKDETISIKEINEKKKKLKNERKKDAKTKIDKKTIIIIVLMLVLLLVILFLIFGRNGKYTITFNTNGGNEITSIDVKNNQIVKLPEVPKKDGYKFVAWINENEKVITKGTKVTDDITLKAEWVRDDAETIKVEFNTDGGSKVGNIVIEKGTIIILPINPTKAGYVFAGWADEGGNTITNDTILNNNMTIKAIWKAPSILQTSWWWK